MQITITGSISFIGQNIINYLSSYQFTEVDMIENKPSGIDFSKSNAVIHLAAIVHQKKSTSEELYFKVNRDLAFETAQEAKKQGIRHFVFFSTIKVYGDGGYEKIIFDEDSKCNPLDPYGKSKFQAEQRLLELADKNFKVSIIRPSMVYGKGVKANMLQLSKLVQKLPIVPLGGVQNKRSMVSIDNLMITLDAILQKPRTGVFLACDKEPVSTSELVHELIKVVSPNKMMIGLPKFVISLSKLVVPFISRRLFGSFHVDASSTHKKLGIEDKLVSLNTGLKKMFE